MQEETILVTKMETQRIVESNKPKTGFAKDGPRFIRYSLADNVNEVDTGMDYHIQVITNEDKPRVIKFLRRFFFRDEPLNQSIKLIPEGEDSTCEDLETYSTKSMDDNTSLAAISTSGAVIGVLLNAVGRLTPPSDDESEIATCSDPKFKKILNMLHYVDKKANLYEKYQDEKYLEFRIISVDSSWRGRGVARALIEKAIEFCKDFGCSIGRSDCTSFYSGKLFKSFGFEPVFELKYADYVDENGEPIFSPASPHTAVVTYVKEL